MRMKRVPSFQIAIAAAVALVAAFVLPMSAQEAAASTEKSAQPLGLPEDWSHHHVVFANPGTEQEAIQNGTHERWSQIVNDPRYIMQQLKRRGVYAGSVGQEEAPLAKDPAQLELIRGRLLPRQIPSAKLKKPSLKKDWNEPLGATTAPSYAATPAKWSFSTSAASCANDFVVYPTGQAGSSSRASVIAYYNLYSSCTSSPSTDWAYNTGGTVALSPVFSLNGNQATFVQASGSGSVTGSVTSGSTSFTVSTGTLTAGDVGSPISGTGIPAGDYIAAVTSSTAGTLASAATATHSGETLTLSSAAALVILKFPLTPPGTGTITAPVTPTNVLTSSYSTCTAPCMTIVPFNGSTSDTGSNPYYDYNSDTLYVGDSVGKLHKFTPVFNGSPAEAGSPWPVQMNNGSADNNQLASPVYDPTSGYVFVGSTSITTSTGGVLYQVGTGNQSTSNGVIKAYSATLDSEYGIMDAPLVDSTAEKIYVFAGDNPSGNDAVYQFSVSFSNGSSGAVATLGSGGTGTTSYQFAGTFDNNYYSSGSATPTGYLYVCGTTASAPIYQVAITNGTMGTVVTGPAISGSTYYGRCSPVTEFYNSNLPSGTATATGTFTGAPTSGQTVTITNGTNVLTLTAATGTAGTGTATFSGDPSGGDTIVVGATTYTFHGSQSTCGSSPCIIHGGTNSQDAANLEAAINDISSQCGTTAPCFYNITTNVSATATVSGAVTTITNTTGSSIAFTTSATVIALSPSSGTIPGSSGSNSCTSTSAGTFVINSSTTTLATNLAAAVAACNTSYPGVGVTATSSGAVVTLTADTAGTAGNSISLGKTLSNFAWSGTTLAGGTNAAEDLIFVSVFAGTPSGCTNSTTTGCIMAYNVTTPANFKSTSTPIGTQNLSAVEYAAPTGGIIVDNGVSTPAGTSQVYFLTLDTSGSSPCAGVCAVQASQTSP